MKFWADLALSTFIVGLLAALLYALGYPFTFGTTLAYLAGTIYGLINQNQ